MNEVINPDLIRVPINYLFVDLETGGLYPDKHPILQVAAIVTDLNFKIKGHFMTYVRPHPDLEVTKEALAINQLDWQDLQSAPEEKAVALALHHFGNLHGQTARFAGYNCQFDLDFLAHLWRRHDLFPAPYQVPWLDIYATAKNRLGSAGLLNFKLVSVAKHFGLDTTRAHDALQDLFMTIEIALRLKSMPDRNGFNELLETAKFSI